MAAPSKAQLLTEVHSLLRKRYKLGPREGRLTVLEAVVYGICHESTTREQAHQALSRFKDSFFDWNEVRVSSLDEIQEVLAGLPEPAERARRIRKFLRQLFEKTYGFSLDALLKKPQKESIKALQDFEATRSDYVLATVIQQALGGHAIPVDEPIRRCLERLGLAEPSTDVASLRSSLERAIPKNRGVEFTELLEELAHDTCLEGDPDCAHCELRKICPTGQARLAAEKSSGKSSRSSRPAPEAIARPAPALDGATPTEPTRPSRGRSSRQK